MPRLHVGLIGFGFIGLQHAKALAKIPDLAVLDGVYTRSGKIEMKEGNIGSSAGFDPSQVRIFTSVDELLANVDVAVIATPTDTHIDYVKKCFDANVHVLCEKPLGTSLKDACVIRRMASNARRKRLAFFPLLPLFHWNEFNWLSEALSKGKLDSVNLGQFVSGDILYAGGYPSWSKDFYGDSSRTGGGALDLGIHSFAWISDKFKGIKTIEAQGKTNPQSRFDRLKVVFTNTKGQKLALDTGWDKVDFQIRIELRFKYGTILFQHDQGFTITLNGQKEPEVKVPAAKELDIYDKQMEWTLSQIKDGRLYEPVIMKSAVNAMELWEKACLAAAGKSTA
jgi:predicted dehydrogenase